MLSNKNQGAISPLFQNKSKGSITMKRTFFKSLLAVSVAVLMSVTSFAQAFADVSEDHFAYEQINRFHQEGIVAGDGDGNFRPDDLITREEFCKILIEAFGSLTDTDVESSFADVENDRWSKAYIELCKNYLDGYEAENGEKTFAPSNTASKEDLVAAVVKAMGYADVLANGEKDVKDVFSDGEEISEDLAEYITVAVKMGLVDVAGADAFNAKNGLTRAQTVEFIDNAVKIFENELLDWKDAFAQLNAYVPASVYDTTVIMTVGDYEVTLAEYRYYYMRYFSQFTTTFGADWINYDEYSDLFDSYLLQSVKMSGVVAKISEEYGVGYSQKALQEMIVSSYIYYLNTFGKECEEFLFENYYATLNFAVKNDLLVNCYDKLFETVYAQGTEKSQAIKEQTLKTYEELSYVRAKHILISTETREKSEAEALATEILEKITKSGEDFDTLMAQYNEDPGVEKSPNGYYFKKGEMVAPFENAVYSLEIGEAAIVETDFGYHIVKKLAIDDEDIYTSPLYTTLSYNEFDAYVKEQRSEIQVTMFDDFESLVSPVIQEAAQMLQENK